MNLDTIKSIDTATDRDLLLMILSTQIQLTRRFEFLQSHISKENYSSVEFLTDDIVNKFDTFLNQIDKAIERKNS